MLKKFYLMPILFFLLFSFIFSSDICINFFLNKYNSTNISPNELVIKAGKKVIKNPKIFHIFNTPKSYTIAIGSTSTIAQNFSKIFWFSKELLIDFSFEDSFNMFLYSKKGVKIIIKKSSDKIDIEKKLSNILPYMLFDGVFQKNFEDISTLKDKNLNPLENCLLALSKYEKNEDGNCSQKKAIIIFTDGKYKINKKKVKDFFKNPITPFFIYIQGKKSKYFKSIKSFAEISGGKVFFAPSRSDFIPSISSSIEYIMNRSYLLSIETDKFRNKIPIKIEFKDKSKKKKIKILYPKFILK